MQIYLENITNYLLTQSWLIAILVTAVAAASWLLRNKSAQVRYLLWLIVLAKCLVPPLLTFPLAVLPEKNLVKPTPILQAEIPTEANATITPAAEEPTISVSVPVVGERAAKLTMRQWVAVAWIAGTTVFLLIALTKTARTVCWLRRERTPLPAELKATIEKLFCEFGALPRLWLVDGVGQPFVWGLLRGSIYLPADFVKIDSAEHRRAILGHELSHTLRFDAAVNFLQVMAQAVFWFHPFIWWANKKIRAEREKCCDEMAIARLGAKVRDYSIAIVNILVSEYESTRPVPSLAVAGPVRNIEERIKTMLRPGKRFYKRPSLVTGVAVLVLALLTVPTTLVLTARAQTKPIAQQKLAPTEPLHRAAALGDIEQVKSLISKGTDVNDRDNLGSTALHYASQKGHTEVAKLLISQGAYVNATGPDSTKPLQYAAMSANKQTVELLLSKGADVNAKDRDGRTALFEAMTSSAAGRKEVVGLLVSKGAKVPEFHLAAYLGDIEKLKKCLQDGIDINSKDDCGSTALHAAANSGKKDIVEFLIGNGATVDEKDKFDMTPLYYAAAHNYEDIADLLRAKGADVNAKDEDGCTLLYYAIWNESRDAIKLLISKGANVNLKGNYGYTPLVYAIWEGDKDIVELLISKGADVNAEDKDGYTPYYYACLEQSKDIVELLIAKGAIPVSSIHLAAHAGDLAKVKTFIEEGTDVNVKDKSGQTPLFSAVLADNNDVTKFLIAKGADVNAKDNIGRTSLHTVVFWRDRKDRKDMAELLIAKGADVNAKDKRRATALHLACWDGKKDVVELLIVKGADVNIRDNGGQTPLHFACSHGQKDVVELLIAKGTDMNAKDNKQQTALSLAKAQGHEEIVELLLKHGAKE